MTALYRSPALDHADAHRAALARVHAVADGLSDATFNESPGGGAWSVGACVEHLNRTAAGWLAEFEPAVADGARRGEGPFEYGFLSRKMRGAVEPGGQALTTGRALDPSAEPGGRALDRTATLATFDALLGRTVAVCDRVDGLDLARIRVRYPFGGRFGRLLRLPLGAALEFSGLHALRHAGQAERASPAVGLAG